MRKRLPILVVLSIILLSATSYCTTKEDTYQECVEDSGTMNNAVVYECSEKSMQETDKEIEELVDVIYNKIKERQLEEDHDDQAFKESQVAWLEYRDNHCRLMGSYVGSPMYSFCPMQLNNARLVELKEMATSL